MSERSELKFRIRSVVGVLRQITTFQKMSLPTYNFFPKQVSDEKIRHWNPKYIKITLEENERNL